jgi:hypothetical protein
MRRFEFSLRAQKKGVGAVFLQCSHDLNSRQAGKSTPTPFFQKTAKAMTDPL